MEKQNQKYLSYTGEYGRPPSVVGTDLPSEIVHEHPVQNVFGETIPAFSNMSMILNKKNKRNEQKLKNKTSIKTMEERKETH